MTPHLSYTEMMARRFAADHAVTRRRLLATRRSGRCGSRARWRCWAAGPSGDAPAQGVVLREIGSEPDRGSAHPLQVPSRTPASRWRGTPRSSATRSPSGCRTTRTTTSTRSTSARMRRCWRRARSRPSRPKIFRPGTIRSSSSTASRTSPVTARSQGGRWPARTPRNRSKPGTYDTFIGTPTWFGFDAFGYLKGQAQGDVDLLRRDLRPGEQGRATLLNEPITSVMKVATFLQGTGQADLQPAPSITSPRTTSRSASTFSMRRSGTASSGSSGATSGNSSICSSRARSGSATSGPAPARRPWPAARTAVFVNDPTEGSNGWIQGADVSSATAHMPEVMTFINWYLDSGVPGAILGVQGYYSPRPGQGRADPGRAIDDRRGHQRLGLLVRGRQAGRTALADGIACRTSPTGKRILTSTRSTRGCGRHLPPPSRDQTSPV